MRDLFREEYSDNAPKTGFTVSQSILFSLYTTKSLFYNNNMIHWEVPGDSGGPLVDPGTSIIHAVNSHAEGSFQMAARVDAGLAKDLVTYALEHYYLSEGNVCHQDAPHAKPWIYEAP